MMHESDTYLMILDEGKEQGKEQGSREAVLAVGEERLGSCQEDVHSRLASITDLDQLKRMIRRAATASSWQAILDTP